MRSTMCRRLGLVVVFAAMAAIFGVGILNAQGIRPPPRPGGAAIGGGIGRPGGVGGGFSGKTGAIGGGIGKPGGAIGNPGIGRIGGGMGALGGGQTIYTCSGCGSRVSESSLSCPVCKARFTNVGPDGKPIDGGAPIAGQQGGPGIPQAPGQAGVDVAESYNSLAIILALIAAAVILLGGGIALFWVLGSEHAKRSRSGNRRRSRERECSME